MHSRTRSQTASKSRWYLSFKANLAAGASKTLASWSSPCQGACKSQKGSRDHGALWSLCAYIIWVYIYIYVCMYYLDICVYIYTYIHCISINCRLYGWLAARPFPLRGSFIRSVSPLSCQLHAVNSDVKQFAFLKQLKVRSWQSSETYPKLDDEASSSCPLQNQHNSVRDGNKQKLRRRRRRRH